MTPLLFPEVVVGLSAVLFPLAGGYEVALEHVVDDRTVGAPLRVPRRKGEKLRETLIPATHAESIRTAGNLRNEPKSLPLLDATRGPGG